MHTEGWIRILLCPSGIFRDNIANESFLQLDHIFSGQNFFYGESGNRIDVTDV
jgi:hypothetical protein